VGRRCSHQAVRAFDVQLPQGMLLSSVADMHEPVIRKANCLGFILLDNDKGRRLSRQFARCASSHASGSADNVMTPEPFDVPFHFAPPKKAAKRKFYQSLGQRSDTKKNQRNSREDEPDIEDATGVGKWVDLLIPDG